MPHDVQQTLYDLSRKNKDPPSREGSDVSVKTPQDMKMKRHGTFSLHLYFLLLTFSENLFLSISPMIFSHYNKNAQGLDENLNMWPPLIILGLWVVSFLGNVLYYKFLHPWGKINGPREKTFRNVFCNCLHLDEGHKNTDDESRPSEDVEMNSSGKTYNMAACIGKKLIRIQIRVD